MIPAAIASALTTAVTTSQAMPAEVPTGTVLTQQDIDSIVGQIGNIQNAINATSAALATLTGTTP